jgi:hypothetical protein
MIDHNLARQDTATPATQKEEIASAGERRLAMTHKSEKE